MLWQCWIQDTKCWRYNVQEPVSENTGGYLNNGYRIQNVEDTTYKIQDPVSENTGGYLKNGYKIQNAEDTK